MTRVPQSERERYKSGDLPCCMICQAFEERKAGMWKSFVNGNLYFMMIAAALLCRSKAFLIGEERKKADNQVGWALQPFSML
jgi:hypothetical protein